VKNDRSLFPYWNIYAVSSFLGDEGRSGESEVYPIVKTASDEL
jgi:hypothetical protein